MAKGNYSIPTLVGLAVLGGMVYMFLAPKILSKPAVAVTPTAVPVVDSHLYNSPVTPVKTDIPLYNPMRIVPPSGDLDIGYDGRVAPDMRFAGATFAENIPGLSYGFPLSGVV